MPTKILASRFNSLRQRINRVLGPCLETNRNSGDYIFGYGETPSNYPAQTPNGFYTIDNDHYNEYSSTTLSGIPEADAVSIGIQIGSILYGGTAAFVNSSNQTRFALNRRPDAAGLAYWINDFYDNYQSAGRLSSYPDIADDPGWTNFYKAFFTAVDSNSNAIGGSEPFTEGGVPVTETDQARSLLATKVRINGDGYGDIGNRGSANPDLIDAAAYQGLYLDVAKVKIHQVGATAFTPLAYKIGDYINNAATAEKIEEAYIAGIESLATDIENNKFDCHVTQADLLPCDTSITATTWNGTKNHIFTVSFTSAQARREYFNAGGLIRFNPSMSYTGSQAKTLDWKSMINAIGGVNFGCQSTIAPSGVGQSYGGIGHDYMSSVYQTAYYNQGGGVYNPNRYTIYAMELSDTVLQFKVELTDPSYGQPDEDVLASVVSLVQFFRPNGTATINGVSYTTVSRPTPTSSTVSSF